MFDTHKTRLIGLPCGDETTMYWLRWHHYVKDIAGLPYKIKQNQKQRTEAPTVSSRRQTTYYIGLLCSTITIAYRQTTTE